MEGFPPGFRFFPTEDELVSFYLRNKLDGRRQDLNQIMEGVIPVLDIYEFNPWELPQFAGVLCHGDSEQWFFFIPRQESEARGGRPNRLTASGYWKATGSPGCVYSAQNRIVGVKRTMVFYRGRAPTGTKTDWKMNEYKAVNEGEAAASSSTAAVPTLRQELSLCRVYKKSKCLRAFDRRPTGGVVIGEPRADQQQVLDQATTSRQVDSPMVERTSSPESSSSGDHGGLPSQTGESSNPEMAVGDEPSWDLEQLDWFCGMDQ